MIKMRFDRIKLLPASIVMLSLLLSAQAFGQSSSVSGIIMDASQAVLTGATATAVNNETGVQTRVISNNAGVYNFASLPPGSYTVTAQMPGFQTATMTDVAVGASATLRLNFELEVSGVATSIEVSSSAEDLLLESSPGAGTAMNEQVVKELPLLGNDLLKLVNAMGGVVSTRDRLSTEEGFAGLGGNDINTTRDGISVNDARYLSGIVSPARLNPEMVGEFKLVLAPVDAEMGRGAGQVQVLTKSGGNEFHGSGIWSILNTALDANEWDYNRNGTTPDWKNVNQYTISVGGPVIKGKTFFFVSWDHNIVRQRRVIAPAVLTPCARKGIYRWFSAGPQSAPGITGWINGNVDSTINTYPGQYQRPAVLEDGRPAYSYTLDPGDPKAPVYTDVLQWNSVLGELTPEAQAQIAADPINCSRFNFAFGNTGVLPGTNWDPWRTDYDKSGYIDRFTGIMPLPNYYHTGDGLNIAAHRWTQTTKGSDGIGGSLGDSARKSITFKIDHNINAAHRLSGTYSYESSFDNGGAALPPPYGYSGALDRKPQIFTTALTSTLRPALLNEFRLGLSYNDSYFLGSLDNPSSGEKPRQLLETLQPTDNWANWQGLPVLVFPGSGEFAFASRGSASHPIVSAFSDESTRGSLDYRWTFADTMNWTKGSHSLKFGGEVRLTKGNSDGIGLTQSINNSSNWYPTAFGGSSAVVGSQPKGLTAAAHWPGLVGSDSGASSTGAYAGVYNLMNYMAGSLSEVRQYYFVNNPFQRSWSDPSTPEGRIRTLSLNQREFDFFFKDDWKVNSDLTLNLGLRCEYYGVPWMLNGMTAGIVGGAERIFGGQEGGFEQWLRGVPVFNPDNLTEQEFIGPGSPNPDVPLFNKDLNNWGPAVGFAWQLPWFGRGKTTLRGGYQVSYLAISKMDPGGYMGDHPGLQYPHRYGGDNVNYPYMDISMLPDLVPTSRFWNESTPEPLQTMPVTDGTQTVVAVDPNVRSPYVQSLTLALTRRIGSSLTVDVRYIGTLSRKQIGSVDLNHENWLNNGLKEAFDIVRAGGESDLLNRMIPPGALIRYLPWSGSEQLRRYPGSSTNLATGNYQAIAYMLGTDNGTIPTPAGVRGQLLRNTGSFPENFIFTNPQYDTANYLANLNHSNYHSLQGQVTLRPAHGLSFQASYTWSRNLGIGPLIADPLNRALNYGILSLHRSHMLTTYGTYNLPMGSNGYLFRGSSGWIKKLVEGWQLSWISSLTSGMPAPVTTVESMWAGGMPDLVRPDLFDTKGGHVTWEPGASSGRFYGNMYVRVPDPQCANVAAILQAACNQQLNALALAEDPSVIVFQKPSPGERGNFDRNQIMGPGDWGLDIAVGKNVEVMEGKSINFRIDVQNVLNHPTPSGASPLTYNSRDYGVYNPTLDLNSPDPFGYIGYKVGHRIFSAKLRITF